MQRLAEREDLAEGDEDYDLYDDEPELDNSCNLLPTYLPRYLGILIQVPSQFT
jgi:hypothetical protein